jgi:hypothetical protein
MIAHYWGLSSKCTMSRVGTCLSLKKRWSTIYKYFHKRTCYKEASKSSLKSRNTAKIVNYVLVYEIDDPLFFDPHCFDADTV